MQDKLLLIINEIREANNLPTLSEIQPEMSLRQDLGFDSLRLATLTVMIEDEFEVDIFAEGIAMTVKDVVDRLSRGTV